MPREQLSIATTKRLVSAIFAGRLDKGGRPIELHMFEVEEAISYAPNWRRHAALLHDGLEDTPLEPRDLQCFGYSRPTVCAVMEVTMDPDVSYEDGIRKIMKGSTEALEIKLSDNTSNLSPRRLVALPASKIQWALDRYLPARVALQQCMRDRAGAGDSVARMSLRKAPALYTPCTDYWKQLEKPIYRNKVGGVV